MSFGFAALMMIVQGVDPRLAIALTIVLVSGILMCIVPNKMVSSFHGRLRNGLAGFFHSGGGER
ncbi:hypothetical protein ACFQZZ_14825 [Nocardia sp. GCM10030253]|uniref:hypothetical protein n=1 Tax=Nocardia sp. GCM10030253 TaxID=3273404 RepID=UPI00362F563C